MRVTQTAVDGENYVGLIGLATDKYAILSPQFSQDSILDVPTLKTRVYGTNLVGMFCHGNSNGLLLPYFVKDIEMRRIKAFAKEVGFEVAILSGRNTALGNMMISNDEGAVISESIRDYETVENVLGVNAKSCSIGGHSEVGAHCLATNKGFICHPDADQDMKILTEVLGVKGQKGTVNCGIPFVKSGIIANSTGYVTGNQTTGIELAQIDEALGFF